MLTVPIISEPNHPDRLSQTKDADYHVKYARWAVGNTISNSLHQSFILNSSVYWRFYAGDQWLLDDDLEGFLSDESGQARNRLKFVENLIKPMVKQLQGNAVRLDYNAKAINISPLSFTRREKELDKLLFITRQAKAMPFMQKSLQSNFGVGETEDETKQLFSNSYLDKYTKAVNNLLRWSRDKWNFEDALIQIAKHKTITGLGIHKGYEQNGEQVWEVTDPLFFGFDHAAKREDLKDSAYMWEMFFANAPELFERFQDISAYDRAAIEKYSIQDFQNMGYLGLLFSFNRNRCPAFEVYWKDIEREEYGYVIDNYGYEYLAKINHQDSKYTDKDLIKPKFENHNKFLGENNKNKKVIKYVDILRYCIFVPKEIIGAQNDVVLEHGIAPYQESYNLDPSNVEFPYKCYCADYHLGEIISPLQTIIDPQRMLNRSLSIMESHFNNARGISTVYDDSVVDAQGGEEELIRNLNLSKPVKVKANRQGVQNVIGTIGTNLGNQLNPFIDVSNLMRQIAQNVSGVNEAMQGTGSRANELVGVQQIKIERGMLLQEKFFYGLKNILLQTYQSVATQGKRIYADSKRRLSMITGDDEAENLIITKEMKNEDFRVFIKEVEPDQNQRNIANQVILQLRQFDLLGEKQAAEIFNKGDMDLVSQKMIEYFNEKQMLAELKYKSDTEKAAQQQQQLGAQLQMVTDEEKRKEQREDIKDAETKDHDINKVTARSTMKQQEMRVKAGLTPEKKV